MRRPRTSSALFLRYNTQLGPPFHIILDTNFINFSIKNKLDIMKSMMDCLYAKCEFVLLFDISKLPRAGIPYVTDCVLGELEKMGAKFKVALKYVLFYASRCSS